MARLILNLRTEQPVLVSSLRGDPNSTVTLPYLTGSMIRGACIGIWNRQQGAINPAEPADRVRFFDGTVRYLNAYPVIDGERSMPTPLSWKKPKVASYDPNKQAYRFRNQLRNSNEDPVAESVYDEAGNALAFPKGLNGSYPFMRYRYPDGIVRLKKITTQLAVHSSRNRQKGRAIKAPDGSGGDVLEYGAVFNYESIAAGQDFRSYILGPDEYLQELQAELEKNTHIWLGRSRSAGYGCVALEVVWDHSTTTEHHHEIPQQGTLMVVALSDLILSDEYGNQTLDLQGYLAKKLELPPQTNNFTIQKTITGGFNRTWGMPLPQTQAIEAGSTCFLEANFSNEHYTRLQELQANGIGERAAEGYGQILIGLGDYEYYLDVEHEEQRKQQKAAREPIVIETDQTSILIWERILRQRFEHVLLKEVGTLRIQGDISNSQLSQLWLAARGGIPAAAQPQVIANTFRRFTNQQNESRNEQDPDMTATAATQFNRSYIEKQHLKENGERTIERFAKIPDWLNMLNKQSYPNWEQLLFEHAKHLNTTIQANPHIQACFERLKNEYTLRLVMAVVKQTRRSRRLDKQGAPQ